MKHFVLLFCFVPLFSFSQYWENRQQPLYMKYDPDSILNKNVSSVTKRRVRMLGDSITGTTVLEQVFYGKDGRPIRQILWNEWTRETDSTVLDFNNDQTGKLLNNCKSCSADSRPLFLKIAELTGVTCFPKEMTELINVGMRKRFEKDNMIEFGSFSLLRDTLSSPSDYFHPESGNPGDSLDLRLIVRINEEERTIEFQNTYIFDPPTNVPQTSYHRDVFHYDFLMRLIWKDRYQANLGYYSDGDRSEYKVSRIVYDYFENGMLKREIEFFEENPYSLKQYGIYIEQIVYEITYR